MYSGFKHMWLINWAMKGLLNPVVCCRCVSRFASHFNQALSVSATFSPCGRFIATGSEDKTAYVYDIRSSSPLHKLKGHSDVVGTLAYHPLTPMVSHVTLICW